VLFAVVASDGSAQGPTALPFFPLQAIWATSLPSAPATSAVTDGVRAFVLLRSGHLTARSVLDGSELWQLEAKSDRAPVLEEDAGLVIVATPEDVLAAEMATGSIRWRLPFEGITAPLYEHQGWLILAGPGEEVTALRARDANLVWQRTVGAVTEAPVIMGNRLYLSIESRVVALDLESGDPVWEAKLGGAAGPLTAVEETLYVGSDDNYLYALDVADGGQHWRWKTGGDIRTPAVADQDRVYFASLDNVLWALDRRSGNQRWISRLSGRATHGLILAGGTVLACGRREVSGFRQDGRQAGTLDIPVEMTVAPILGGGAGADRLLIMTAPLTGEWAMQAFSPPPLVVPLNSLPGVPWLLLPREILPKVLRPAPPPGGAPPR
jgi:outer membrane protein assembly factor BamB